jgi:hypothetical protein
MRDQEALASLLQGTRVLKLGRMRRFRDGLPADGGRVRYVDSLCLAVNIIGSRYQTNWSHGSSLRELVKLGTQSDDKVGYHRV